MGVATNILIIIAMAILVPIITVTIYFIFYRRMINKRLANGNTGGKPMMSPLAFFVIAFICVTVISFFLIAGLSFLFMERKGIKKPTNGFDGEMLASIKMIHTDELEDSPFSGYTSGGELKGYDRYEVTDGDVTFYYYKVKDNMHGILPRLIICPECEKYEKYPMVKLYSTFKEGNRRLYMNYLVDNEGLFAVNCDGFEGDIDIDTYYFAPSQETLLSEPGQIYNEELMKQAEIQGHLSLNMAYPVPSE